MTDITLNQEHHSYMFDEESTPVKTCSELGYHVTTCRKSNETIKKLDVQSETHSAAKRRRMLHFEDQPMETSLFSSECFSSILKSNAREEALDKLSPEGSQLIEGFFRLTSRQGKFDELSPEGSNLMSLMSFHQKDLSSLKGFQADL
ncbi:unnamed protein product [Brassica napus]|uniref:(rape) hypothetical protein n=1 Tax=Brassica napus TaxID=3708 RepID=A0A816YF95_BRANA|nr:unnamed protein product [Brassica napus]